jgi:hypothetical protein
MMRNSGVFLLPLCVSLIGLLLVSCGDDDSTTPSGGTTKKTSFDHSYGWSCASGESCQDVFDVSLPAGATVTFTVTDVTGDSIVQLALYGPGEPLGGTNHFTGSVAELRCNYIDGCDTKPDGQAMTFFGIPAAGTYRLAITRDWGESCGSSGTYRLLIHSSKAFVAPKQTVDDVATLAVGTECP